MPYEKQPQIRTHDEDNKPRNPRDIMLDIGSRCYLFRSPQGSAYAEINVRSHKEVWALRKAGFRTWLAREFYQLTGKGARQPVIAEVLDTLEAKALFDDASDEHDVFIRIAPTNDAVYIDLGCPEWRVIEVTPCGWKLLDKSPVRFIRSKGTRALPTPIPGTGDLEKLWSVINVEKQDRHFLIAALVAGMHGRKPFPVVVFGGHDGSGKSTNSRVFRSLIDPRSPDLRSPPKDDRDLAAMVANAYILALDNVSNISTSMSDELAKLSTGIGIGGRELYTDMDEATISVARMVVLNGIGELVTRADLLSRSVIFHCPTIGEQERRTESDFEEFIGSVTQSVFTALLDALSGVLRELPGVKLDRLPRMADFAKLCVALARYMGWDEHEMVDAIWSREAAKAKDAVSGSPVGVAILRMLEERHKDRTWHGTVESLLSEMEGYRSDQVRKDHWPSTPQGLGRILVRLETALRLSGWDITRHRAGDSRNISIERIVSGKETSCLSETSRDTPVNDICDGNDVSSGETFPCLPGDAQPRREKPIGAKAAERMADEVMGKGQYRESF